jgi:hypothetical protein
MSCNRFLAVFLGAAAVATVADAQNVEPGDRRPPRYRVEVIVFANDEFSAGEESFRHRSDPGTRVAAPVQRLQTPRVTVEGAAPSPENPFAFEPDYKPLVLESLTPDAASDSAGGPGAFETPPGSAAPGGVEPPPQGAPQETDSAVRPDTGPGTDRANELPVEVLYASATGPRPFRFRLLRRDELQLTASYNRLRTLSAYTPLAHGGWVQEALPAAQAVPFDLSYLGSTNPSGTVRLHVARFLHVTLDVEYQPPRLVGRVAEFDRLESGPLGLAELELPPRYSLVDSRRARSGELHYIDHPAFGVLVLVTPVSEDSPDEPAPGPRPAA